MDIVISISQYNVCHTECYLIEKKETVMKYSKPKIVAQNATEGSYAAGCPEKSMGGKGSGWCRQCERSG